MGVFASQEKQCFLEGFFSVDLQHEMVWFHMRCPSYNRIQLYESFVTQEINMCFGKLIFLICAERKKETCYWKALHEREP